MQLVPFPVNVTGWSQDELDLCFQLECHRSAMELLGEQTESIVTTVKFNGVKVHCDIASAVTGCQYWALVMAASHNDVPVNLLFLKLQVPDGPGWVLLTQWSQLDSDNEATVWDRGDHDEANRLQRALTSMVLTQIGW